MNIGYARVSTEDQDLNSQVQQLMQAGCEVIYQEKISGKRTDRPEMGKMLASLQPQDVVIVCKLDRLGRSLSHLLSLIETFKAKKVGFKSLGESMDTTTAQGMMIFGIFGVIADFERALISERTRTSLQYLKTQGKKLGPPLKDRTNQAMEIKKRISKGEPRELICQAMGLSRAQYFVIRKMAEVKSIPVKRKRKSNGRY